MHNVSNVYNVIQTSCKLGRMLTRGLNATIGRDAHYQQHIQAIS